MRRKKRIAAVVIAVIVTAYLGAMVYLYGPLYVLQVFTIMTIVIAILIWAAETLLE